MSAPRGRTARDRTARSPARRARGFTLIEAVLATSLLALGLALAFGILRGATRATSNAETVSEREGRLRAVQSLLRTQVNAALPIGYAFDAETGEATFCTVTPRKLELVATMPGYLSRGGPYVQTFELVDGPRGQRLLFTHRMLTPDGPLDAEREPIVLLDGIAEARFQARTLDDKGRLAGWGEWRQSAQLPPLVRLEVRFADARGWPEVVASTRLGSSVQPGVPGETP
jgi:general secretion pathway protein J